MVSLATYYAKKGDSAQSIERSAAHTALILITSTCRAIVHACANRPEVRPCRKVYRLKNTPSRDPSQCQHRKERLERLGCRAGAPDGWKGSLCGAGVVDSLSRRGLGWRSLISNSSAMGMGK
jgi:hypothetical protein